MAKAYGRRLVREAWHNVRRPETRAVSAGLLAAVAVLLFAYGYWLVLLAQLPSAGALGPDYQAQTTIAYMADGQELTRYHDKNRVWIPFDSIATHVVEALVATEDRRFYEHWGIDLPRVAGSVVHTLGGSPQGGSTITMQLVRNAFPSVNADFVVTRKIKEWITALRIEGRYDKNTVLEMYLNTVPFMYNAYGIEAAARTYFQKPARDLGILESATLVGMLRGTALYNPVRNPGQSQARRNVVLGQMVRHGYLSQAAYDTLQAQATPLSFKPYTRSDGPAPHFAEYVRQWLDAWAQEHGYNLYTDGLRVYTTLDPGLQQMAEAAATQVAEQLEQVAAVEWSRPQIPFVSTNLQGYGAYLADATPFAYLWTEKPELLDRAIEQSQPFRQARAAGMTRAAALDSLRAARAFVDSLKQGLQRLEVGFVALDPRNGHVKAWVGGRDFEHTEYDHVALAKRQPGSTFKPFVYATALEHGYTPNDFLQDRPIDYLDPVTRQRWRPRNSGGVTGRMITLSNALALSKNTITAQLMIELGAARVAGYAHRMGIKSDLMEVPSLGLGTSEVTLLELTAAYGTLASQGRYREPVVVTRIADHNGKVLATFSAEPREALSSQTAYSVLDMMRGVVNRGTGQRIRSVFGARGDLAGKTGTTQGGADGWFMLMHPDLVMGAWMGFDEPSVSFRSNYWGQGAHNALQVVGGFYRRAAAIAMPPGVSFEPPPDYQRPPPPDPALYAISLLDPDEFSAEEMHSLADSLHDAADLSETDLLNKLERLTKIK